MSASTSDISELDSAPAGPDDPDPDPGIGEADESVTAEAEPVEAQPAPDPEPDLAAVLAERDAYLADLQRVTAEFTNFRRQTMKRNTELVAQAASRLARELLVVLDACEAAVGQGVEGIEALQSQLLGVLSAEGLTVLGAVDEPFDPGFHEAVMSEESTDGGQDAPLVAEVLRTGYAWNGRVLRPAMVKVRG
ncbi:MAG: nucleotide exchange factor GrpE [Acidimicrobiaceae bacterium]|nr:nucleotide exchange factor GrpE [Acidimicrobiaceae bacterium]